MLGGFFAAFAALGIILKAVHYSYRQEIGLEIALPILIVAVAELFLWNFAGIIAWQTTRLPVGFARLAAVLCSFVFGLIIWMVADGLTIRIEKDVGAWVIHGDRSIGHFFGFAVMLISIATAGTAAVAGAYFAAIRLTFWVIAGFRQSNRPAD